MWSVYSTTSVHKVESSVLFRPCCFKNGTDHVNRARGQLVRVVKEADLKSAGLCPQGSKSPSCRFVFKSLSCRFVWKPNKNKMWRSRVSIPVPRACKARALPFELHPLTNTFAKIFWFKLTEVAFARLKLHVCFVCFVCFFDDAVLYGSGVSKWACRWYKWSP